MLVPAATAVTVAVVPDPVIVAADVLEEVHAPVEAAVPFPVNVLVWPAHLLSSPVKFGSPLTVMVVAAETQPLLSLKVMVVVPSVLPVTTPVFDTVAMVELPDTHGSVEFAVALPVKAIVALTQTELLPVMVGSAFTVTLFVVEQPLILVNVIVAVPAFRPVTTPNLFTLATVLSDDFQGVLPSGISVLDKEMVLLMQTLPDPVMLGNALTVKVIVLVQLLSSL